ncbi:hypothetical protein SAMN05444920_10960 [Nonomuraea solani]|uniref:NIPSNAP protein n=1 Tax=Nonomuraea solani TaxID=1144553 RepID=A0A1H6EEX8_9ACTN|nr:hypothetical protein [Nonomuraea solani]SEG95414.1 hypothetical protein SAMN05444920_10960 [Nonomuraea solani]
MLHLVYRLRLTQKANSDMRAFWEWAGQRQTWFYSGLDMVEDTKWYVCTVGPEVHSLEHFVTFADESAWGRYRQEVARRGQDPAWERRRTSQEEWWELLEARLLNDPPATMSAGGGE